MRERDGNRSRARVAEGTAGRRRGAQVVFRPKHGAGFIDLISARWLPLPPSRCSWTLLLRFSSDLSLWTRFGGFPVMAQLLRELVVSCLTVPRCSRLVPARTCRRMPLTGTVSLSWDA